MSVGERIKAILRDHVCVDAALIMPSATCISMKMDSLDQVEFGVWLENEFGIDCEQDPFDKIATLGELEFAIEKHQALGKRVNAA